MAKITSDAALGKMESELEGLFTQRDALPPQSAGRNDLNEQIKLKQMEYQLATGGEVSGHFYSRKKRYSGL